MGQSKSKPDTKKEIQEKEINKAHDIDLTKMIKCVAISDTHNKTDSLEIPEGDILFHSGDFTGYGLSEQIKHFKY